MTAVLQTIQDAEAVDGSVGFAARRWTLDEYHRMAEAGILGTDEHVELIEGEIIGPMPPQLTPHSVAVRLAKRFIQAVFDGDLLVDTQLPIVLEPASQPEPDLVVVPGPERKYLSQHPSAEDIRLVVEISDTTLSFDRGRKARLYAKHGIADYWIVNLVDRCVEVRRDPDVEVGYRTIHIAKPDDVIEPLSAPGKGVRVADLLP